MAEPVLAAIGRAVPGTAWPQRDLIKFSPWPEHAGLVQRLFQDSPIQTRHLFVPPEWWNTPRTLSETNAAWREGAMGLATEALREALAQANRSPTEIDQLSVTTVTGYTTPGLDLRLGIALGLRNDFSRAHFNCVGCHAAVPLLKVAADHVGRRAGSVAAAVAVEVCSACFSPDAEPGRLTEQIVATSLFADGAAAALVTDGGDGPRIVDFYARYDYAHQDALGFDLTAHGFRIVLDPRIPDLIAAQIEGTVLALLTKHGLTTADVSVWAVHPGGSRILDAVQRALRLSDADLWASRQVLRRYGNMSSPTVLFCLAEALREPPPPGSWGLLCAFGPGLGIEVALLSF